MKEIKPFKPSPEYEKAMEKGMRALNRIIGKGNK